MKPWLTDRLAANGHPVRVNFSAWFGASAMVDPRGEPLEFFHGTNQPLEEFSPEALGRNTSAASSVLGIWFTSDPRVAAEYADMAARHLVVDQLAHERKTQELMRRVAHAERSRQWGLAESLTHELEAHEFGAMQAEPTGQCILPVYLKVERPHIVDMQGRAQSTGDAVELIAKARDLGCDGVVFRNSADNPRPSVNLVSDHVVVFRPQQVKSAIGNSGLYLPHDPSLSDHVAAATLRLATLRLAIQVKSSLDRRSNRLTRVPHSP